MVGRFQVMALLQAARHKRRGIRLTRRKASASTGRSLRFGQTFPQAWEQAVQIVGQTDRATLESRRKFYEEVYQPRRDDLAKAWSALSKQARSL